jgi:hypothetical protein
MNFELPHIGISELLISYLIPIILFCIALKCILDKLGIFRFSNVNWWISALMSISTIYFLRGISLYITGISILAICLFKIEGGKKYLIGIAALFLYFAFILPFLKGFLG